MLASPCWQQQKSIEIIGYFSHCGFCAMLYICDMETPMLVIQNREDANDVLARRINLIYSRFGGGLGEFFERLHRDQRKQEAAFLPCESNKIGMRPTEVVAARTDQSECGDD
jgi:hypothetical protein